MTCSQRVGSHYLKMDSIILRKRVVDRRQTVAALQTNLTQLSVSYSWDGLGKFNETLFCGLKATEKTLHRLFAFSYTLPDSGIAKFEDVDTAARLPSSALCFIFRVRKLSTFTAFFDVFWLNQILLRIQTCRSIALINALAYLRILLHLHFAMDKLEKSYKRLIFQPSPLWTAVLHRFSYEDNI